MDRAVSRRAFLAGVAGAVAASRLAYAQEVPTIVKRVEKLYKVAGSTQPNDLQFVPEGLWVLDQLDQPTNKAFLVKPEDGTVLREILTEALHASGITYGNGALWIGSTKGKNAQDPPKTMKVDPQDRQDAEAVEHAWLGTLRPHERRARRHAVGRARPEVDRRQILDGGPRREQGVPDGARDRRRSCAAFPVPAARRARTAWPSTRARCG